MSCFPSANIINQIILISHIDADWTVKKTIMNAAETLTFVCVASHRFGKNVASCTF